LGVPATSVSLEYATQRPYRIFEEAIIVARDREVVDMREHVCATKLMSSNDVPNVSSSMPLLAIRPVGSDMSFSVSRCDCDVDGGLTGLPLVVAYAAVLVKKDVVDGVTN
jgi:hypothetical protein